MLENKAELNVEKQKNVSYISQHKPCSLMNKLTSRKMNIKEIYGGKNYISPVSEA